MTPLTRTVALPAALLLAGGLLALSLPAASSIAGTSTLCNSQTATVDGGAYTVDNNEWGSSAFECITTNGRAEFRVANSQLANDGGSPGGYPDIYKGCNYGACTSSGSGMPIRVSKIHAGTVRTSWSTAQPGGSSVYNVAYDIWFNKASTTSGQANGAELMIWLNHHGRIHPYGSRVASNVIIGGRSYNVYFGNAHGFNTVTYTMTSGKRSVTKLDLRPLEANAVGRGYISRSWYLISVEAGFEVWKGGVGLATRSFSVDVNRHVAATPR
jgi:cellulose 1,4-beta-cellobiosidase